MDDETEAHSAVPSTRPGAETDARQRFAELVGEDERAVTVTRQLLDTEFEELDQLVTQFRDIGLEHPIHWAAFVCYGFGSPLEPGTGTLMCSLRTRLTPNTCGPDQRTNAALVNRHIATIEDLEQARGANCPMRRRHPAPPQPHTLNNSLP